MLQSTAKICTRCHEAKALGEFHVKASRCKKCACEVTKEWRLSNSERAKASVLAWKDGHENYPFYRKRAHLKHRYGITPERCEEMLAAQNHSCAICAEAFTETPHVDHCHESKIVRGLLCDLCNRGLGYFKDSPNRLERAVRYLKDTQK